MSFVPTIYNVKTALAMSERPLTLAELLDATFGTVPQGAVFVRGANGYGWSGQPVLLLYSQATKTAITSSGDNSFLEATGAVGTFTPGAGFLNSLGRVLRIRFGLYATTAGASPGTGYLFFLVGSTVVATMNTGNLATSASSLQTTGYVDIECKTVGSSGKLDCSGFLTQQGATPFAGTSNMIIGNASAAGTVAAATQITGIDLAAATGFDFKLHMSADLTNTFTVLNITAELLG